MERNVGDDLYPQSLTVAEVAPPAGGCVRERLLADRLRKARGGRIFNALAERLYDERGQILGAVANWPKGANHPSPRTVIVADNRRALEQAALHPDGLAECSRNLASCGRHRIGCTLIPHHCGGRIRGPAGPVQSFGFTSVRRGGRSGADAEGVDRARSATEAFLFRRLETLAETKGRFRLNERLPIAFDASSALEADLLCVDARLVIELDGAQHLGDAEAYRRDRRKDRLLQENGYFVLRFLAEDLGRHLDDVLDAILRGLGRPRRV
ncbi:MAG: DUF559 domain-containing protein [Reyranellaceae bacterium]